ncbi:aminotransferase-like domain-containing protein [Burkholderia multivorans]|uniref:aminotransferase-like domain-containing protein n=1 Tax=Burkholderia multivorans TaxID=87883 RepID=UPI000CFFCD14|nr:PLP-dependent aminotransferase family protein [Burkholderia multivorans]MBU9332975.1 PLP-dependent aminotransferase family protein [Burkholderia multivorans]PRE17992.1 GntR family transcriptional regulator [Burkholderia multivorans]PRG44409.1 GntR family transcriptional regulator [Burkholderia multivorans]
MAAMKIALDPLKPVSLKEQLVYQIEDMIRSRQAPVGTRLPSIRQLATANGVSRFPVMEAYDHLVSRGLIEPRHGSGFYVTNCVGPYDHWPPGADPEVARAESGQILRQFDAPGGAPPLSSGFIPAAWRDVEGIAQSVRHVSRTDIMSLVDYAVPQGDGILRTQISRQLARFEIGAPPQQILVTHSTSHALDLVARMMLRPGDTVFVEDPGYFNLFGLLKLQGIQLIGVPRLRTGPDVDAMQALLAAHRPKLFFVNTVFHNPTATNIAPQIAFAILQLAQQYDFYVVEDDVYADLQSAPTQRLAALDQLNRVIYVSGFSKTLSSSLRLGYIAAHADLIRHLVDVKTLTSMGGTRFAENVVATLLERGLYRRHMEKLRHKVNDALMRAVEQLRRSGWETYEEPCGGMFVWARVPHIEDSARLVEHAAEYGINIAPGAHYRPGNQACPWLRFNAAYMREGQTPAFLDSAASLR